MVSHLSLARGRLQGHARRSRGGPDVPEQIGLSGQERQGGKGRQRQRLRPARDSRRLRPRPHAPLRRNDPPGQHDGRARQAGRGDLPRAVDAVLDAGAQGPQGDVLVLLLAGVLGLMPPLDTMWSSRHHLPPSVGAVWIYNYAYWLILACVVAQVIDTWMTLQTFAKKEAEQRAQLGVEWDRFGTEA